jgi:hypothetical protein
VAYNFQTGKKKIKLFMEYESVTQNILFAKTVLAALISGRKYDAITQHGDCGFSKQSLLLKRNFVTELNMEKITIR